MSHAKIGRFSKKQIFELPDGTHRLEPHLYVRVRGNGRYRNYFFRYLDPKGRVCDLALGSASKKPLSEVKQFAFLLKTSLQFSGKASALMEAKQRPVLFKDYARRVIEILASVRLWKNPAQKQSWSSSISTYAFPVIGEKFIDEIDRKDILKILRPIWINKTMTASRVRGRLEKIFAYAINENLFIGNNPASWKGNLDLFLPPANKCNSTQHFKSLSFTELKAIIPKLQQESSIGAKALLFGVLTATRTVEFTQAHWREISWKEKVWLCPPSRRKDGKEFPFRVPPSQQVISLLKEIRKESKGEFIFSVDGKTPIRRETPRKFLRTALNQACTMHGMRSTFRDWCAENDIDNEAAEKSLMHTTGTQTTLAYQRSDLLDRRRVVMQLWADALFDDEKTKIHKADLL